MNQDAQWKPILKELIEIAKKHNVVLGCPDFVNSGPNFVEQANTCCGINVPNPTTFNTHNFKRLTQIGISPATTLKTCWDGSGDWNKGKAIVYGKKSEFYTLRDAGVLEG